jgi:hypothetical protein
VLHETDTPAPPEPVQPEPVTGSALSVEASVIPTDNQPEVFETSPTPERETVVKRMTITSRHPQSQPNLCPILTIVVSGAKRLTEARPEDLAFLIPSSLAQESNADDFHLPSTAVLACAPQALSAPTFSIQAGSLQSTPIEMAPAVALEACAGAPSFLILGLLAQESLLSDHEYTYTRKRPKQPNKALVGRSREPSLSKSIETQSIAPSSVGSIPRVLPSPSASPQSNWAKPWSPVKVVSRMSETSASLGSPCPRAAPMLPIAVPVHPSQALSVRSFVKPVPRQRDIKNVVKAISKMSETNTSQDSPCAKAAPMLLKVAPAHPSQVPSIHSSVKVVP